jgi:ABC-2 type transport system permease protein
VGTANRGLAADGVEHGPFQGLPVGRGHAAGGVLLWAEKTMHLGLSACWIGEHVVARIRLGVAQGSWFVFAQHEHLPAMIHEHPPADLGGTLFSASWSTLGSPSLWIGVAAGVAMIAAAVWMRRRREEG